jgi:hypothetical protein
MSSPFQQHLLTVGKMVSLFCATLLVALSGLWLHETQERLNQPVSWPSLSPGTPDGRSGGYPWWKGPDYKPVDWSQFTPVTGQEKPQPWTPVRPGQEPVHIPDNRGQPPRPAPRVGLP